MKFGLNWSNYSTMLEFLTTAFFYEETSILFAVLKRTIDHTMGSLPEKEVMKKWWKLMQNILETNPDGSIKVKQLDCMFHLD